MKEFFGKLAAIIYFIGSPGTFVILAIRDWHHVNWWNWIIIFPVDVFLSSIWPIYWVIIYGLFGMR